MGHEGMRRPRGQPRGDRRQRRADHARPLLRRAGRARRLRQVAAGHDDGDGAAERAVASSSTAARSCRGGPGSRTRRTDRAGRVRGGRPAQAGNLSRRRCTARGRWPAPRPGPAAASSPPTPWPACPRRSGWRCSIPRARPAPYESRDQYAEASGRAVMELLARRHPPARHRHAQERSRTPPRVVAATGGSTNAGLHLPAIAHEAGITFTLEDVCDDLPHDAPTSSISSRAGSYVAPRTLRGRRRAGGDEGAAATAGLLHGDCLTVTAGPGREPTRIAGGRRRAGDPPRDPISPTGGVVGAQGQPRPGGGDREDRRHRETLRFEGPARVLRLRGGRLRGGQDARLQAKAR
ncbi:MAG: hypothetical protein KatS3mg118_0892 [Paracoccaceae bacterium]|nr:MAG: hypothetical protein KatS3mg118_0892 [Paracoccaceae bacterium]